MATTVIGKFDYDGDEARIEGDSVTNRKMIAKVAAFLKAKPLKGKNCVAQIIEGGEYAGWIEHVEELPLKQEEKKPCTSSGTPANNTPAKPANDGLPKTVEGQIIFIDHPAHKITVKDKTGKTHDFVWPATVKMTNNKGEPLKQWWFVKVTGEKSGDLWKLTDHTYFKRPDDWPFGKGGGGGGQPRNERLILFQNMHTAALNGAMHATTPDSQDYDEFMDTVYVRAKKDTEQAMKDFAGGA